MNYKLNELGYLAAAAFVLESCLAGVIYRHSRDRSVALLLLALLLGIDAFTWSQVGDALKNSNLPHVYPPILHTLDVAVVLLALTAAIQFTKSKFKDRTLRLDEHARWGLVLFGAYSLGCVVYWMVVLVTCTNDSPLWKEAFKDLHAEGQSIGSFAALTAALYLPMGLVAFALAWPHFNILKTRRTSFARRAKRFIWRHIWLYSGQWWKSVACWISIPLAAYALGGPTHSLLINNQNWYPLAADTLIGLLTLPAAVTLVSLVFRAAPLVVRGRGHGGLFRGIGGLVDRILAP